MYIKEINIVLSVITVRSRSEYNHNQSSKSWYGGNVNNHSSQRSQLGDDWEDDASHGGDHGSVISQPRSTVVEDDEDSDNSSSPCPVDTTSCSHTLIGHGRFQ